MIFGAMALMMLKGTVRILAMTQKGLVRKNMMVSISFTITTAATILPVQ